ncbi:dynein assembly factor 5, axonemal-like [Nematolebias whitei]|uniref:dynein assembly factor 5, axonemal-like n=1 Tax=Nematolebias whitei TaxID=451745 RepID=UPI00189B6500|nr:dynein assembly factor 5, axonemal-like [Nematolebias whitei]
MAAMEKAGDEHAGSEVLRGLHRHLNCLNEDNKATRKRALEFIKKETIDKGLSSGVLQEVFSAILKPLLKCLSDPMERCRETTIVTMTEFIRCVPNPEECLPYLLPCLAHRFGEKEILEPAEELRLLAVEMLTLMVEVCGKHLAPYLNEIMSILQRTIVDPFPDVKRESCKCTVIFAKCVPEHFHMQAESLVKPLMLTITHQHSRVRVSVIEATGAVIQHGTGKNVDDVLSHLAQRLFDDSPQVRKAVTVVVGDWLLNMRDRYSYFHKLIPLLLSTMLRLIGTSLHHEALNKIYPELLKRLDDSSEEVRGVALQAVGLWLSSVTKDYNPELCAPHLQLLFQQLLLHLDDPDSAVQDQVLEILKSGSSVHPALLKREAEAVRDKQRSPYHCDVLLQHISSLSTESAPDSPK